MNNDETRELIRTLKDMAYQLNGIKDELQEIKSLITKQMEWK